MRLIDADALKNKVLRTTFPKQNLWALNLLMNLIDEAPTIGGWISVTDRLPDTDGEYLIFSNGYVGILPPCISTALFAKSLRGKCLMWDEPDRSGFYNYDGEGEWEEKGVTHWMPLPEPPGN